MSLFAYLPMLLYLVFAIAMLALTVVTIRFLLAATRWMNRKAELLRRELESGERRLGSE